MKRKFAAAVIITALTAVSADVSFADTEKDVYLRSYFADVYRLIDIIVGENAADIQKNGTATGKSSRDGGAGYFAAAERGVKEKTAVRAENGDIFKNDDIYEIYDVKDDETGKARFHNFLPDMAGEDSIQAVKLLELVNGERQKRCLSSLLLSADLNEIAQLKAEDMAEKRYFSHNSPAYGSAFDMMKEYGISYMNAGENIAKEQSCAEDVMSDWMNSEGHRENILRERYDKMGAGCAADETGKLYWVQIFIGE